MMTFTSGRSPPWPTSRRNDGSVIYSPCKSVNTKNYHFTLQVIIVLDISYFFVCICYLQKDTQFRLTIKFFNIVKLYIMLTLYKYISRSKLNKHYGVHFDTRCHHHQCFHNAIIISNPLFLCSKHEMLQLYKIISDTQLEIRWNVFKTERKKKKREECGNKKMASFCHEYKTKQLKTANYVRTLILEKIKPPLKIHKLILAW